MKNNWKNYGGCLMIGSFVSFGMGLFKMFAYSSSEYNPINCYVGGDAYNYIINSNYATAFFVLGTGLAILSFICEHMYESKMQTEYLKDISLKMNDHSSCEYLNNDYEKDIDPGN